MNELRNLITAQIDAAGPMPLADYMSLCLQHPKWGYYTRQDPFGRKGDFITAPEISQIFGESLALGIAQTWIDQGAPRPFSFLEMGPGRGTLLSDMLRVWAKVPDMLDGAEIYLLESSPYLRVVQAKALPNITPIWIESLDALPAQPLFFVANEFFDALPITQYCKTQSGWGELRVAHQAGALMLGQMPSAPPPHIQARFEELREGDIVEDCPLAREIAQQLGVHITANGGAGYIIDYGDWVSLGNTLQAMQNHSYVDPFDAPGEADLTSHVDFAAIANASGCAYSRLTPQGVFLERLGITARAQSLAKSLQGDALDTHIAAHRRLTHPDEMGQLFKTIALFAKGTPIPAGVSV